MPTDRSTSRPNWFADRRIRFITSVFIVGHLWAVMGRPLEFATQGPFGTSPSASALYAPVKGYSQFAYLDHGYAFFAPDPGPSHFIRATVSDESGKSNEQKYPDIEQQWPRLLYHRHFMLAEFFNDVYHPPGDVPQEIASNPIARAQWIRGRKRYEAVRDSIVNHLQKTNPGSKITIQRVEHRQPGLPEFIGEGIGVNDLRLLQVLPDTLDGRPEPTQAPEMLPNVAPVNSATGATP